MDDLFKRRVDQSENDGIHVISCKLGLWSISGRNRARIEREAKHYWAQYLADGEYDEFLEG